MDNYRDSFGNIVDLENDMTYNYLPKDIDSLDNMMFMEIGRAHCYMNYIHSDIFGANDGGQKERVEKLIKDFVDNRLDNRDNLKWYQKQVFLFQDETENMC